jgi:hypothetical protein
VRVSGLCHDAQLTTRLQQQRQQQQHRVNVRAALARLRSKAATPCGSAVQDDECIAKDSRHRPLTAAQQLVYDLWRKQTCSQFAMAQVKSSIQPSTANPNPAVLHVSMLVCLSM